MYKVMQDVCLCMCVCLCVCVTEAETERQRQREIQHIRETHVTTVQFFNVSDLY